MAEDTKQPVQNKNKKNNQAPKSGTTTTDPAQARDDKNRDLNKDPAPRTDRDQDSQR